MPKLPGNLSDSVKAAEAVFTFWFACNKTDGLIHPDDPGGFHALNEDMRQNFIDAIRVELIEPFAHYLKQLEAGYKAAMDDLINQVGLEGDAPAEIKEYTKKGYAVACYCCGKYAVNKNGDVCQHCLPQKRKVETAQKPCTTHEPDEICAECMLI